MPLTDAEFNADLQRITRKRGFVPDDVTTADVEAMGRLVSDSIERQNARRSASPTNAAPPLKLTSDGSQHVRASKSHTKPIAKAITMNALATTYPTGFLTLTQAAKELNMPAGPGLSAVDRMRRLIAIGAIAHYPQPDGNALLDLDALGQYLRNGQPRRDAPPSDGRKYRFDDLPSAHGFTDLVAQGVREAITKDSSIVEDSTAPVVTLPMPKAAADHAARERSLHAVPGQRIADGLTNIGDQVLTKALREAAQAVARERDQSLVSRPPLALVYASPSDFRAIVDEAWERLTATGPSITSRRARDGRTVAVMVPWTSLGNRTSSRGRRADLAAF